MAIAGGPAAAQGAEPVRAAPQPRARVLMGWALLVIWSVTAAGCAGGTEADAAARAPVLYVGNGRDGTVTRLDAGGGHALGAPLPAGEAPWQLAVGPAGELLVLPVTTRPGAPLTYVTRDRRSPGGWRVRPVPLEPGARAPLLAGGGRHAVVAYQAGDTPAGPESARCRVALFDLAGGRLGAPRDVCAGPDTVVGLAAGDAEGDGAGGALAYLAIWRRPTEAGACLGATGSRVVALRPAGGAPMAVAPLAGVPGPLVLGAAPGRLGRRLYAAEAVPWPDAAGPGAPAAACPWASYREQYEGARAWRVWGLDATTLAPEAEHAVAHPVRAIAVTPDGDEAFVLTGLAAVLRLAPAGGPAVWVTTLPELALGLVATDERLYTLDVLSDRLWGLDRRHGAVVQTLATGRRPIGLVLAGG